MNLFLWIKENGKNALATFHPMSMQFVNDATESMQLNIFIWILSLVWLSSTLNTFIQKLKIQLYPNNFNGISTFIVCYFFIFFWSWNEFSRGRWFWILILIVWIWYHWSKQISIINELRIMILCLIIIEIWIHVEMNLQSLSANKYLWMFIRFVYDNQIV